MSTDVTSGAEGIVNYTLPLGGRAFEDALAKGHGRAYLHVQQFTDAGVESALRHACLNDLCYDQQCEGNRGEWLLSIVAMTNRPGDYHDAILAALPGANEDRTGSQLAEMVKLLAQSGNEKARKVFYERFGCASHSEARSLGDGLIELDGLAGLVAVAEKLGAELRAGRMNWEGDSLISYAAGLLGEEQAISAIEAAAKSSANVSAYVQAVRKTSGALISRPERQELRTPGLWPLEDYLAAVDNKSDLNQCRVLARSLTPEIAEELVRRLAEEQEPERLKRWLWLLWRTTTRDVPQSAIDGARSPDKELHLASVKFLSRTQHRAVRKLALELLAERHTKALNLLERNCEPGDFAAISEYRKSFTDLYASHHAAFGIVELCERNLLPEAHNELAWVYEENPCAICRWRAAKQLYALGRLPVAWRHECLHDSYEDTRLAARGWPGS